MKAEIYKDLIANDNKLIEQNPNSVNFPNSI